MESEEYFISNLLTEDEIKLILQRTEFKFDRKPIFDFAEVLPENIQKTLHESLLTLARIAENFGSNTSRYFNVGVDIFKDFAPYSMYFVIKGNKVEDNSSIMFFNGGIIYHGQHDNGGDGGAPTYSVNISPMNGWSIHT